MSIYYDKCPRCGNTDLDSEVEIDIVTVQYCDCGWHKEIGYVAGFPGNHCLVPYESESTSYSDIEKMYLDGGMTLDDLYEERDPSEWVEREYGEDDPPF